MDEQVTIDEERVLCQGWTEINTSICPQYVFMFGCVCQPSINEHDDNDDDSISTRRLPVKTCFRNHPSCVEWDVTQCIACRWIYPVVLWTGRYQITVVHIVICNNLRNQTVYTEKLTSQLVSYVALSIANLPFLRLSFIGLSTNPSISTCWTERSVSNRSPWCYSYHLSFLFTRYYRWLRRLNFYLSARYVNIVRSR